MGRGGWGGPVQRRSNPSPLWPMTPMIEYSRLTGYLGIPGSPPPSQIRVLASFGEDTPRIPNSIPSQLCWSLRLKIRRQTGYRSNLG